MALSRDPTSNADIDELVDLARSALTPEAFAAGLDDGLRDDLLAMHSRISYRYGARAASRAVARLGGAPALQALLKAMHKRKLLSARDNKLMAEIDAMLADSAEIDAARGQARS